MLCPAWHKKPESFDSVFLLGNNMCFANLAEIIAALFPNAPAGLSVNPSKPEAQAIAVHFLIAVGIVPIEIAL